MHHTSLLNAGSATKQKIIYDSEEDAEDAARLSEFEHGLPQYSLHAYKCDMGNHWHIANVRK